MTVASAEIGLLAAEQVRDIYARSDSADCWKRLVRGGWSGLGADPDADLDVRALVDAHRRSDALVTLALVPNREPEKYGGAIMKDDGTVTGFAADSPYSRLHSASRCCAVKNRNRGFEVSSKGASRKP